MIHYEIPKPKLSPNFTIEDIHKLRYWNYERLKDATLEERIADEKARSDHMESLIESSRERRRLTC